MANTSNDTSRLLELAMEAFQTFLMLQAVASGKDPHTGGAGGGSEGEKKKKSGGMFTDADEQLDAALKVKLLDVNQEPHDIYVGYQGWEFGKGRKLEAKLGKFFASRVRKYVRNRQRTIITGIPNGDNARDFSLDFVLDFCRVIKEHKKMLDDDPKAPKRESTRWELAYKKGQAYLETCGIPRIPDLDDVLDLVGWINAVKGSAIKGKDFLGVQYADLKVDLNRFDAYLENKAYDMATEKLTRSMKWAWPWRMIPLGLASFFRGMLFMNN